MQQATFDITLQQHLIISQQAATAGAHHSHDYIPGSVLLGLAASRLYAQLDEDAAWTLFHSGLVRFGDALPTVLRDSKLKPYLTHPDSTQKKPGSPFNSEAVTPHSPGSI